MHWEEEYIPDERIDEFREAFKLFDRDGDGSIDVDEFIQTLRSLGRNPSQLEVDEMVNKVDVNGDGEIDFEEFKVLMFKRMKDTDAGEDIKDSFTILDAASRGYISASDVYRVATGLGEKMSTVEAKELVDGVKTKVPGKLNFEADHCFDDGYVGRSASALERILCGVLGKETPGKCG